MKNGKILWIFSAYTSTLQGFTKQSSFFYVPSSYILSCDTVGFMSSKGKRVAPEKWGLQEMLVKEIERSKLDPSVQESFLFTCLEVTVTIHGKYQHLFTSPEDFRVQLYPRKLELIYKAKSAMLCAFISIRTFFFTSKPTKATNSRSPIFFMDIPGWWG